MVNNWFVRILLSPFAIIYGLGIGIRNFFYDTGLLKSANFNIPVISIGNLSIGGAGKTPHVEYLIRALKEYTDIAVLSRGYKRKTKGFRFVELNHNALYAGDEPLQYKRKYRDIVVAVSESRAIGIPQILKTYPQTKVVILDDAFQHRAVNPTKNILLTQYDMPYSKDYLLPSGRLRENRSASQRADIVVVTKCPSNVGNVNIDEWREDLQLEERQKLFFSYYQYDNPYSFFNGQRLQLEDTTDILLISAIANTSYLLDYLSNITPNINHLDYEDHHLFTKQDIEYVNRVFTETANSKKIILTTEKDAMRLALFYNELAELKLPIYVLPVQVQFHFEGKNEFDNEIKDFLLNFRV